MAVLEYEKPIVAVLDTVRIGTHPLLFSVLCSLALSLFKILRARRDHRLFLSA